MSNPARKHQPWEGDTLDCVVERVFAFGVFVRLPDGSQGYIRRRELTLSGESDPREVVREGQNIQAVILNPPNQGKPAELSARTTVPDNVALTRMGYPGHEPLSSTAEALEQASTSAPAVTPPPFAVDSAAASHPASTTPPADAVASYLFLSYSSADQTYVQRLADDLKAHGLAVWFDDQIDLGERWWRTIVQAIYGCAGMVIVMSPDAEASDWVEKEILLARQEGKPILPLLLRGKGLPLLIEKQYEDVSTGHMPPERFYSRLQRVIERSASGQPGIGTPAMPPRGRATPPDIVHATPAPGLNLPPRAAPAITTTQKMALVRALLNCEAMADRQSRAIVVADLPPGIRFNIRHSERDREDVSGIVTAALNYPDGLDRLLDIVRFYEEDSFGMRAVEELLVTWGVLAEPATVPASDVATTLSSTVPPLEVAATPPPTPRLRQELVSVVTRSPTPVWRPPTVPIAFDWVEIPASEFIMGSDLKQDEMAHDNEQPRHIENLATFWIARVTVTVAQFAAFVEVTGYKTTADEMGSSYIWTGSQWKEVEGAYWRAPRGPGSSVKDKQDHPVTCISWWDATAFCRWAGVRLPTEAEWEKAARGTDGLIYPWGNNRPDENLCNFNMNVEDTTAVGSYPAGKSPYGVLDMSGNVWEWTQTKWRKDYSTPADERTQGEEARVMRGGSFRSHERNVRCAFRGDLGNPNDRGGYGFRVCAVERQE